MTAFSDVLIEFHPQPGVAPSRCMGYRRQESCGPSWRLRAETHPDRSHSLLVGVGGDVGCSWTVGDVYNYKGVCGDTASCVRAFLEDWQAGCAAPERLAGRFAILSWSPQNGVWSVWTDRVGSVHIYYAEGADRPALGTYSPAVYSVSSRRLDWAGLSGFFALGFFPQDRTHMEGVRVLRPASRYEFDAEGKLLRAEPYWEWWHDADMARSEPDTIAEFGEIFRQVLREQTRTGRIALPLSGGLDSRTVAACLPVDCQAITYSYGYTDDSVETRIARQVAKVRGLTFTAHTIRPYLLGKAQTVTMALEGFQDITQARQAAVASWLHERADFVLAAHWGDVLCDDSGQKGNPGNGESAVDSALRKFAKRGRKWLLDHLCRPHLGGEEPEAVVRGMLESEMKRFAHIADPDFRLKALKTAQWAFRWTLPSLRMYQEGAFPRMPFLDPRVIDFFCTVPTAMVRSRRLQIEFLKRFAPELARVRWQAYDADLFHYQYFNSWLLPRRAMKKVWRSVGRRPMIQRNWEVQFFSEGQWELLEASLLENRSLREFVPPAAIRALLDEFRVTRSAGQGYTVSMLLTFATWLESFGASCSFS